jgi:hypothetical protein
MMVAGFDTFKVAPELLHQGAEPFRSEKAQCLEERCEFISDRRLYAERKRDRMGVGTSESDGR